MKVSIVERTLAKLAELIERQEFAELESDTLEIKPVPSDRTEWREQHRSACAFLNTRGGIFILGIKEEGTGASRRYVLQGWRPHAEPKLKEFPHKFTDRHGKGVDLSEAFPEPLILDFMTDRVAVLLVDELPADLKYVFYEGEAYHRVLTGDHKLSAAQIERQEEFREEALHARELLQVPEAQIEDLDVDKVNEYITQLNRPVRVEMIKPDLQAAIPFLERKCFVKDGKVTTLGMLVCGRHPVDYLGFRCQVHGYVDVPGEIARDKQDLADNVLALMEGGLAYLIRNIQVGISAEHGGTSRHQYPEELLRETVNNALAHRDYAINRQVILAIKPGDYISVRNPGEFRKLLLIEDTSTKTPLLRILPEAKPRNPKLADVLRVFRKWEGRGIGMSTLVSLALENRIELPYYRFGTEEVTLFLPWGKLVDDRMERHFKAFDRHIETKLRGMAITAAQMSVLAYLIKSEWANEQRRYTILLTPDNNHFTELQALHRAGLIEEHATSTASHPVYQPDRDLVRKDYVLELQELFGPAFDVLDQLLKDVLGVVYRFNHYSKRRSVTAKEVSFNLWYERGGKNDIKAFESLDRKVRRAFNTLESGGFVFKDQPRSRGYLLNTEPTSPFLTYVSPP